MESPDRAYERLLEADPVWVDVRRAGDAIPGMTSSMILTSGPPASFPSLAAGQQQAIVGGALFEDPSPPRRYARRGTGGDRRR